MDPVVNVKVGTLILDDANGRSGSPVAGLQSYNVSDKKKTFANRVIAEKAHGSNPLVCFHNAYS